MVWGLCSNRWRALNCRVMPAMVEPSWSLKPILATSTWLNWIQCNGFGPQVQRNWFCPNWIYVLGYTTFEDKSRLEIEFAKKIFRRINGFVFTKRKTRTMKVSALAVKMTLWARGLNQEKVGTGLRRRHSFFVETGDEIVEEHYDVPMCFIWLLEKSLSAKYPVWSTNNYWIQD